MRDLARAPWSGLSFKAVKPAIQLPGLLSTAAILRQRLLGEQASHLRRTRPGRSSSSSRKGAEGKVVDY